MYYFLDVVKELYHRKDLGSKVENANQSYVSLFERMLSEVLLLQRSKFNVRKKLLGRTNRLLRFVFFYKSFYFIYFIYLIFLTILITFWIKYL